jgi:hypothetical protein
MQACGEWNTLSEKAPNVLPAGRPGKGRLFALEALTGEAHDAPRLVSGIAEFDRVTGGGFARFRPAGRGDPHGVDLLIKRLPRSRVPVTGRSIFRRGSGGSSSSAGRAPRLA